MDKVQSLCPTIPTGEYSAARARSTRPAALFVVAPGRIRSHFPQGSRLLVHSCRALDAEPSAPEMPINNPQQLLKLIAKKIAPLITQGELPSYIPELRWVRKDQFGMAYTSLDGEQARVGDADVPFSIQSISKLFSLTLALERLGDEVWARVGREPSGMAFNELIQVDQERGAVRNPFVNAGALVVTDMLCSRYAQPELALLQRLRQLSGSEAVDIDKRVMESERQTCDRNAAIAHLLKSYGSIRNPVGTVLDTYCRQCALTMTAAQLSTAARMLASTSPKNLLPGEGLTRSQRHSVIAVMLTCGTYNASGGFAARVGLPLKSGVGGGIVAVIPGHGSLCAWSPGLDETGNSVAAGRAVELFAEHAGVSLMGGAAKDLLPAHSPHLQR